MIIRKLGERDTYISKQYFSHKSEAPRNMIFLIFWDNQQKKLSVLSLHGQNYGCKIFSLFFSGGHQYCSQLIVKLTNCQANMHPHDC